MFEMTAVYFPAFLDCAGNIRPVAYPHWRNPVARKDFGRAPELELFAA